VTSGLFITGTDTAIGKTTIALGLMSALQKTGLKVAAMKPVSAGCKVTEQGLRNEDAVLLMQQASVKLPYELVNPYAFEPAIAPHIAAAESSIDINIDHIQDCYQQIAKRADIVVIEGAGGWLVPINKTETMADVAMQLNVDIVTVVGIRLGCLNHALLTVNSINAGNFKHRGWIANHINDSTKRASENIETLRKRIAVPLLDEVQFGAIDAMNLDNSACMLMESQLRG
jgi:dethiobiotin synthetase